MKRRKSQSILEYTLLLGVIIGAIVLVLLGNSGIKDKITNTYNKTGDTIENVTNNMNEGIFGM